MQRSFPKRLCKKQIHLLGYDHMEEEDEKVMFGKQNELLDGYGITKGYPNPQPKRSSVS